MKLSTKGRYGVMAMLDLAIHTSEGTISLKSIADRQNISENYLEQLFALLKKNGLIKSVRGAQGGYILGKNPDNISVGEILRALEGSLAPVECVMEKDPTHCSKSDICVTRLIWERMRDKINELVDSITLTNLMEDYYKMNNKDGILYYI